MTLDNQIELLNTRTKLANFRNAASRCATIDPKTRVSAG